MRPLFLLFSVIAHVRMSFRIELEFSAAWMRTATHAAGVVFTS